MKALIFDSGTLINLSMNGLLYILKDLKKTFKGKFIVTKEVKYEVVDRPIGIKRFELGAMRVKTLLDEKVLELPSVLGITDGEIKKETQNLMKLANNSVFIKNKPIKIVSDAEISCIALSYLLSKKTIPSLIAVDERTIRILSEKPENLEKIMERKLHQKVKTTRENLKAFSQFKFIRSSEIVFVAHKKELLNLKGPKVLEAVLYATKFKGAAISFEEIDVLKKL